MACKIRRCVTLWPHWHRFWPSKFGFGAISSALKLQIHPLDLFWHSRLRVLSTRAATGYCFVLECPKRRRLHRSNPSLQWALKWFKTWHSGPLFNRQPEGTVSRERSTRHRRPQFSLRGTDSARWRGYATSIQRPERSSSLKPDHEWPKLASKQPNQLKFFKFFCQRLGDRDCCS